MKGLVAQQDQKVNPLIFLPRIDNRYSKFEKLPAPEPQSTPQFIPVPYPVPTQGNQGNNQGGFNSGRALGAMVGYLGMGFGDPAFSPGPMLAGRYGNLFAKSPSFEIPGGESPYRFGPYLPYRGEEKKEEQTPFIPNPRKA
jgi:hypothetical protein